MKLYTVQPEKHLQALAGELEKLEAIKAPSWARYVKTGMHKERPPTQTNWWYMRAASILRKVAILGPIGTNKLRVKYGGRKNRGHKPDAFKKGSGNIIRTILQQLEASELVKQDSTKGHKGRVITPKGASLLDKTTKGIKQ